MADSVKKFAAMPPTKKELIIEASRKLFLKLGFSATSMDAIASEAGVSKRTVYSHFQNKEALFEGIVISMCQELGPPWVAAPFGPPEEVLSAYGRILLDRIFHPEMAALLRVVVAESAQFPDLGEVFWEKGPGLLMKQIAAYLAELDRQGVISIPSPKTAALQFIGLISGPYLLPVSLFGIAARRPSPRSRDRILSQAVSMFLRGLGGPRLATV